MNIQEEFIKSIKPKDIFNSVEQFKIPIYSNSGVIKGGGDAPSRSLEESNFEPNTNEISNSVEQNETQIYSNGSTEKDVGEVISRPLEESDFEPNQMKKPKKKKGTPRPRRRPRTIKGAKKASNLTKPQKFKKLAKTIWS